MLSGVNVNHVWCSLHVVCLDLMWASSCLCIFSAHRGVCLHFYPPSHSPSHSFFFSPVIMKHRLCVRSSSTLCIQMHTIWKYAFHSQIVMFHFALVWMHLSHICSVFSVVFILFCAETLRFAKNWTWWSLVHDQLRTKCGNWKIKKINM